MRQGGGEFGDEVLTRNLHFNVAFIQYVFH